LGNNLVELFWSEIDFEFTWWRFRYLADPKIAEAAAIAAAQADLLIFAAGGDSEPPSELVEWVDRWMSLRSGESGLLVPLVHPPTMETMEQSPLRHLLEKIAEDTGLECLAPEELANRPLLPGPVERLQRRATQVTGLLSNILKNTGQPPAPPGHWGINE
jgi:hypothetical protein